LVEGQIIPHALGPGSQPGNEPARVLEEFGAKSDNEEEWGKGQTLTSRLSCF
jgi:hypothetical protein